MWEYFGYSKETSVMLCPLLIRWCSPHSRIPSHLWIVLWDDASPSNGDAEGGKPLGEDTCVSISHVGTLKK